MVSNNGNDWETIYTFKDIKEESTLQYILPRAKKVKYLAVVATSILISTLLSPK